MEQNGQNMIPDGAEPKTGPEALKSPQKKPKEIQRQRMRRHFLDACKEIILTEGLERLSTKKIGELAGYSYATIYNYFENFNELVCLCVEELAGECASYVAREMEPLKGEGVLTRVLGLARLMVQWNSDNPNRYFPFLSTQVDFSYFQSRDGEHFFHPVYAKLMAELSPLKQSSCNITDQDLATLTDIFAYVFHSKLHFFIRYQVPKDQRTLQEEVKREVEFLLRRVGCE